VVVKFLPDYRNKPFYKGFPGLVMFMAMFFFLLGSAAFLFFQDHFFARYEQSSPLFVEFRQYVLPIAFCIGFSNLFGIYLFASFRSTFPTIINDVFLRLYSIIIISLYFLKLFELNTFVMLFAGGFLLQLSILKIYVINQDGKSALIPSPEIITSNNLRRFMNFALSMSIMTIANMAIKTIDVVMLGSYVSLDDVAVYSIGILVASFIELPVTALGKIADSKISESFAARDMDNLRSIYNQSTRVLLLIGCFLFVLINTNIGALLSFLPEKFHGSEIVVNIISISALSNMLTGVNSSMLLYTNKNKSITVLLCALVVVMVILNRWLMPAYGIIGAAMVVVIIFILFNLIKAILIWWYFKLNPYQLYQLGVLVLFGLTAFMVSLIDLQSPVLSILIRSLIVTMVAALIVFRFKDYSNERMIIMSFLNKIRKAN
jgi:O-antigen/teichoic acid export membrane protein